MKRLEKEALNHYAQIIEKMNQMDMSKDQQIEYLKARLLRSEYQMRRKRFIERLLFAGFFFALLSFYFISMRLYLLGFLLLFVSSVYISYKIITIAEENIEKKKENKRKKLVSLLDSNLE